MVARRLTTFAAVAGVVTAGLISFAVPRGTDANAASTPPEVSRAAWADASPLAPRGIVRGRVEVSPGTESVTVTLGQASPLSIPDQCRQSTVRDLASYLDGRSLVCELVGASALEFVALVDGSDGSRLTGTVVARSGGQEARAALPTRLVYGGPSDVEPDLRLVSSPDLLNADVGDLRRGPNRWTPRRSTNSTNPAYERAIGAVLDDWQQLDPAAVLVAGDLVNGRWGFDDDGTGTFGPVTTLKQRKAAVRRAARTYYPQWQQRFDDRGLPVFPSVGDHEFGDSPFHPGKRRLATTFRQEFARQFTTNRDGSPRYADHPQGPARLTAFAGRPSPDLQIVSLDVFDITAKRARIRIDPQQLRWLERVLAQARADRVRWIVVESHVPIIFPVRARASSALHYEGGTSSRLWRVMKKYGVDLYLSGEVHDTQLAERDGIVQVSHGGAFQFGLTTALVLDFYGGNLLLTLRDYDVHTRDGGRRLWETRRRGLAPRVSTRRGPRIIGTATLTQSGLVDTSGILTPVR
ncbi:metallophosphoesterase [Nocardioides sp. C4-1]|uniref:metallophosphoesterase family protein n=1 Tax=Nocardioides sp. C4-1 TaxID=3151851 RepID=UPI003267D779